MSDLKHRSQSELVSEIKRGAKYRKQLRVKIAAHEEELGTLRNKLNGSFVRSEYAVRYLEGSIE